MNKEELQQIAKSLLETRVFASKRAIAEVHKAFKGVFDQFGIANGDDCAAIDDGQGGWLLLACEGILPELVQSNPELAGRSAVLANVNDIYAMGGRPLAMVDVVGANESATLQALCKGMRDNCLRFGVPLVGGHLQDSALVPSLAVAILGRAQKLMSSFDAQPGDRLILITNLDGLWLRGPNYWNCTLERNDKTLRSNLELICQVVEADLVHAGKDVSMSGIAGTLIMLCEASKVGAILNLAALPLPKDAKREQDLTAWLSAFFSYGFLMAVAKENVEALCAPFLAQGLSATVIGSFVEGSSVLLEDRPSSSLAPQADPELLFDWAQTPFVGGN